MYRNGVITPPSSPVNGVDDTGRALPVDTAVAVAVQEPQETVKRVLATDAGLNRALGEDTQRSVNEQLSVKPLTNVPGQPRVYEGSYTITDHGHPLGRGAWSDVHCAVSVQTPRKLINERLPITPPTTPEKCTGVTLNQAMAVKQLARRDGKDVLKREACILTYLHSYPDCTRHLVAFYGYEPSSCAVIMDCIPLTLENYAATAAQGTLTSASVAEPAIGLKQWTDMASDLTSGLVFLHDHGCVHGDIKPSNILLRHSFVNVGEEHLEPLFCDFSSSRVDLGDTASEEDEEISAVTVDYASPELLQALMPHRGPGRKHRAVATFPSDVFALGVTLIFAITGRSPYSQARLLMQKNAMASEGNPLLFAKDGDQGSRIGDDGICERMLRGALCRDTHFRWRARMWKQQIQEISCEWRATAR